jgi:hypothetical protein
MYTTNHSKNILLISLSIIVILLFGSFAFFIDQSSPSGNIVAQGGNISNFSITQLVDADLWSVLYGGFDEFNGVTSVMLSGGVTSKINFSSYGYDSSMVVIASDGSFDISDISQAPPTLIDAYLGVGPTAIQSGSNTFDTLYNITIKNQTYELYGTQTLSINGTYITAAFLSNGSLSFVTTTTPGVAFDNTSTHFQFMLPSLGIQTYEFSMVSNVTCPSSFDVIGYYDFNTDRINLNWSDNSDAFKYRIFYTDQLNSSNYLEFSSINSSNTTNDFFIDPINSSKRFYEVEMFL